MKWKDDDLDQVDEQGRGGGQHKGASAHLLSPIALQNRWQNNEQSHDTTRTLKEYESVLSICWLFLYVPICKSVSFFRCCTPSDRKVRRRDNFWRLQNILHKTSLPILHQILLFCLSIWQNQNRRYTFSDFSCWSNHSVHSIYSACLIKRVIFSALSPAPPILFVILLPWFSLTDASLTLSVYAFNLWKEISKFLFRMRYQVGLRLEKM